MLPLLTGEIRGVARQIGRSAPSAEYLRRKALDAGDARDAQYAVQEADTEAAVRVHQPRCELRNTLRVLDHRTHGLVVPTTEGQAAYDAALGAWDLTANDLAAYFSPTASLDVLTSLRGKLATALGEGDEAEM